MQVGIKRFSSGLFRNLRWGLLGAALLHGNGLFAQTSVSGPITSDTTWDIGGSPYTVTGSVTVNEGVTLTIDPGVTVEFSLATELSVLGTLAACLL